MSCGAFPWGCDVGETFTPGSGLQGGTQGTHHSIHPQISPITPPWSGWLLWAPFAQMFQGAKACPGTAAQSQAGGIRAGAAPKGVSGALGSAGWVLTSPWVLPDPAEHWVGLLGAGQGRGEAAAG